MLSLVNDTLRYMVEGYNFTSSIPHWAHNCYALVPLCFVSYTCIGVARGPCGRGVSCLRKLLFETAAWATL